MKTNVDIHGQMKARIEAVRDDMGLSRMAFCRHIHFDYQRYHHMTGERGSKPTADLLAAVTTYTNVNSTWLLTGDGTRYQGAGGGLGIPGDPGAGGDSSYVLLPLYGVQGSAGDGGLVDREEVEDLLAFKREWIAQELRTSPENLALIHVQGESMVPTLNPGDVILVERGAATQTSDGIYVLRMGEALLVKRLQFLPEGEVRVCSDNPAYAPFSIHLGTHPEDYGLIGRVVWAGRRF